VQFDAHKINTGIGNHNICLRIKPLFDEDTYEKAALVRRWAAKRFPVELAIGTWNRAALT